MPMYEYECSVCGRITDHHRLIAERFTKADCESCGRKGCCELVIRSAPSYHGERIVRDKRIIRSEQEVIAERGKKWRDEGTTGKEGGAGKKLYSHG